MRSLPLRDHDRSRFAPPSGLPGAALVLALLLAAPFAGAEPFDAPRIDGVIGQSADDWAAADRVVNDRPDDNSVRTGNVRNFWLTWDADSLYVGLTYQAINFGMSAYFDLGREVGVPGAAVLDTFANRFAMPAGRKIDLLLANRFGAYPTAVQPQVRLVTSTAGATLDVSARTRRAQTQGVPPATATVAARFPFYYFHEVAIPWDAIYGLGAGRVPARAVLRAVAVITGTDPATNGVDSAPDVAGLDGGSATVTLDAFHVSVLDVDGDGRPDPANASAAGAVSLPDNPGNLALTAVATLRDWAGGQLGAPLATVVTAAGATGYAVPRLPAGTYDLTVSAPGYVPVTRTLSVAAGEQVTGFDFALTRATLVSGTISFLSGPGAAGTVSLIDDQGAAIGSAPFPAAGGGFTLYAVASGTYRVEAAAATYVTTDTTITVTAGVDVTGLALRLPRQTEVSGTVSFAGGPGSRGLVRFADSTGATLGEQDFFETGGPFRFFTDRSGDYRLTATPTYPLPSVYLPADTVVAVARGVDLPGLALRLPLKPRLTGAVAFAAGPGAAGTAIVTATVGAGGDTLAFTAAGGPFGPFYLAPGEWRLGLAAPGYVPRDTTLTLAANQDVDLGTLALDPVRATRLVPTDAGGVPVTSVATTVSIPDSNLFFYAQVWLEARDDAGRRDLYDVDGRLAAPFALSARKLDDVSAPRGEVGFFAFADTAAVASASFTQGVARFLVRDDAVEILRVTAASAAPDAPLARVIVGFGDPQPQTIVLTADRDTLVADDLDEITVTAQLYDSASNPSRLPGVPIGFALAPASTGRGAFRIPTVLTNADGRATAVLAARGAGRLLVTAAATAAGRVLAVRAGGLDGPETLEVTALPGPPAAWEITLAATATGLHDPVEIGARLVDALGNVAARAGVPITFTVEPPGLGALQPATATSDAGGTAAVRFLPAGVAGIVTVGGASAGYAVTEAFLRVRDALIETDPRWDREPPNRHTFPPADLTALIVDNTADALLIEVPLASTWGGLQVQVLLEVDNDAAGAGQDAFVMPVNFAHAMRPDYQLTVKYDLSYGDFRRWDKAGAAWQWWDRAAGAYVNAYNDNVQVQAVWAAKEAGAVRFALPWAPFGARPDSLRLEVYLTQEDGGVKRSAFDSVPSDSTLNLTFDYENPGPNDWVQALGPVTLQAWSRSYRVKTDFPPAPAVSEAVAQPAELRAGDPFTLRARVQDGGGGVGDVLADLSAIGAAPVARLYDDGDAGHGDQTAGDGFWSLRATVPLGSPGGALPLVVSAWDATNASAAADTALVEIGASVEVIVHAEDPAGDDHGPNQPGQEQKYYTYPTNSAFIPGAFDLTTLDVYETTAVIGGEPVEAIAFRVGLADFPNPTDPGRANWNPRYASINVEKIDIMIDSGPGGATFGLPNRRADFQAWDAWDYAIIMDGWYKAVVPSLGQNTAESWRQNARRDDRSITLASDFDDDHVTALVARDALGDPSPDDIRKWDICVAMSGHDQGNDEQDMGATRWVNESRGEWNFGGGYSGDRDANLIDLLLAPGVGREPGPPQEQLLDYESPEAVQRLEDGLTPCAIEMTAFEDTGPPVVRLALGAADVLARTPLRDAPIAFTVEITDDYYVDRAEFRYRPAGFAGGDWAVAAAMGYAGNDLWTIDLMPEWIAENLTASPLDGARYLEFQIAASDALDKTTASPVLTMRIEPPADCLGELLPVPPEGIALRTVDGTTLRADAALAAALAAVAGGDPWEGPLTADSLSLYTELCTVGPATAAAPAVPAGQPLGVFRQLRAARVDADGAIELSRLPGWVDVSLHYPQDWVPDGADENTIGLYEYQERAGRWVLVGGNVNAQGNNVTARVNHLGLFGLFRTDDLGYDEGEVVSGIVVSPNPFSPNEDGLYDEATISFYLSTEATVSVEVYSSEGRRERVITETFPYSGEDDPGRAPRRVAGLTWDGRDQGGQPVPYGVYILRLMVTYNQAGGTRTVRSTHPVAVIR